MGMKISVSEEIKKDASLTVAVGKINYILAAVLGDAAEKASVQWELAGELRSRILFLQLWYEDQGSGVTIDLAELEKPDQLRGKLRELWGDLLQVRMDGILRQLRSMQSEEVAS
jgi:hypothetical protein